MEELKALKQQNQESERRNRELQAKHMKHLPPFSSQTAKYHLRFYLKQTGRAVRAALPVVYFSMSFSASFTAATPSLA